MPPPIWQGRLRQRKTSANTQPYATSTLARGKHSVITTLRGPHDPQNNCPLFSLLPTELRHIIYILALRSYDDKARPYPDEPYFSRHEYGFHQLIATPLLLTCRQIYTETHDFPVSLNVHVFCYGVTIDPRRHFHDNPLEYFSRFTVEQKAVVDRAHIFVSLQDWEMINRSVMEVRRPTAVTNGKARAAAEEETERDTMRVKNVKLTVSYKNLWPWHVNPILSLASHWGEKLKSIHGLKYLEVEIDTIEQNKYQIEAVVSNLHRFRFAQPDSSLVLTTEDNAVGRVPYLGRPGLRQQSRYTGHPMPHYPHHPPSPIPFIVTTFRWTEKKKDTERSEQSAKT